MSGAIKQALTRNAGDRTPREVPIVTGFLGRGMSTGGPCCAAVGAVLLSALCAIAVRLSVTAESAPAANNAIA